MYLLSNYRRLLNKDTDIQQSSALCGKIKAISAPLQKIYLCIEILYTIGWEKFFEQTGLSLKKMDDLIFFICY